MASPVGAVRKAATATSRLRLLASSNEGEIASQYQSVPLGAGAKPAIAGWPGVLGVPAADPAAAGADGPDGVLGATCTVIRFVAPACGTPTRRNVNSLCKRWLSANTDVAVVAPQRATSTDIIMLRRICAVSACFLLFTILNSNASQ